MRAAEAVAGLRELADFLEANLAALADVDMYGGVTAFPDGDRGPKLVAALPGIWQTRHREGIFEVRQMFGAVRMDIWMGAELESDCQAILTAAEQS